jgi:hypothetical protein
MKFFLFISTVFNGIIFYSIIKKYNQKVLLKKIIISIFALIILSTSFICIISEYSSPNIWQPNRQVTYRIYDGSTWFIEYRDTRIQDRKDFATDVRRIEHYINGFDEGNIRMDHISKEIPSHFNYDKGNSLFKSFDNETTYMITTENARQAVNAFPDNVKSKVTQFTKSDFNKLYSDTNVNKIFENGEYECWYITD